MRTPNCKLRPRNGYKTITETSPHWEQWQEPINARCKEHSWYLKHQPLLHPKALHRTAIPFICPDYYIAASQTVILIQASKTRIKFSQWRWPYSIESMKRAARKMKMIQGLQLSVSQKMNCNPKSKILCR